MNKNIYFIPMKMFKYHFWFFCSAN